MKWRPSWIGIGLLTALSLLPIGGSPAGLKLLETGSAWAENVLKSPKVNLQLSLEKRTIQTDNQGREQVVWQPLSGSEITVAPGDTLRYKVVASNQGKAPAKSLVVTQPIPQGMFYLLNSAGTSPNSRANTTFSIDGGKTFVANPVLRVTLANGQVEERPAPASAYTHVRWQLTELLDANQQTEMTYQVKVR